MLQPDVTAFFDEPTFALTYVLAEPQGNHCAIIDSVLDYDLKSGRSSTESADELIKFVSDREFTLDWILETHAHADHLTAAAYLKEKLGGRIAIGARVTEVQKAVKEVFNFEEDFTADGKQFDHLFSDGEGFAIGSMVVEVMPTPGHTLACVTYGVGDAAFVGDTLFMPDFGTARTDFPGGDPATLYASIKRILSLPPETRLFMCHDYGPDGRDYARQTSVAEERADNIHGRDGVSEQEFVNIRTERDAAIDFPNLILPSIQVNIRAGRFSPPEANGVS